MKPEDILYEAILIAEKNGYKGHLKYLPLLTISIKNLDNLCKKIFYMHRNDIIFSHEFAKAFWGKNLIAVYGENKNGEYENFCISCEFHLQQMVLEKGRIDYLEKFLTTNKEE